MHSIVTSKNESWSLLIWPTLYVGPTTAGASNLHSWPRVPTEQRRRMARSRADSWRIAAVQLVWRLLSPIHYISYDFTCREILRAINHSTINSHQQQISDSQACATIISHLWKHKCCHMDAVYRVAYIYLLFIYFIYIYLYLFISFFANRQCH